MSAESFIDTNIWFYLFTKSNKPLESTEFS
jgi:predicted nucleic acid-binding protein